MGYGGGCVAVDIETVRFDDELGIVGVDTDASVDEDMVVVSQADAESVVDG